MAYTPLCLPKDSSKLTLMLVVLEKLQMLGSTLY